MREHSFWEIGNGEEADFFRDSWQHAPKIREEVALPMLQDKLIGERIIKVKDMCNLRETASLFRQWKSQEWLQFQSPEEEITSLVQILEDRKIEKRESPDRIRWGYRPTSQFNVKEAAEIASGASDLPSEKKWSRLWGQKLWPKITLFLWLLLRGRILTWENLRRRGMTGPSMCVLCHKVEETSNHLFKGYEWSQAVWESGRQTFDKPGPKGQSIQNIIEHWRDKIFKNAILNRIWETYPGFVVWEIWKEQNSRIFYRKRRQPKEAWRVIVAHITKSLGLKQWGSSDM